jgi:hypothetical protein
MTRSTHTQGFDAYSARLNALVDEAQVLMDQLCSISEGQGDAIKSGDIAQVVEIVVNREPVVQSIVRVGEEIGAFIADPSMIDRVDDADRAAALGRISSIEHAMKRLRERDAKDQQLMEEARDGLADQLAGMGTNQNALRAYSNRTGTPNPILQDRQG